MPDPVPKDKVPPAGAVALLPLDSGTAKAGLKNFKEALSSLKGIDLQVGPDSVNEKTRALVWLDNSAANIAMLEQILDTYPAIGWIQLPMAGINAYAGLVKKHSDKIWTSAKGAYSQPVAEHALMIAIALLRFVPARVRATSWGAKQGIAKSLYGSHVVVVGAGGITTALLAQLEPFRPTITVLRRRAEPLDERSVPPGLRDRIIVATLAELNSHLGAADVVVMTCALTPETHGCMGKAQFDKMQRHAVVVNVARGEVIRTDDLAKALEDGTIGGAGLDVTDPEPLPDGHPLWSLRTSHPSLDMAETKGGGRANLLIVSPANKSARRIDLILTVSTSLLPSTAQDPTRGKHSRDAGAALHNPDAQQCRRVLTAERAAGRPCRCAGRVLSVLWGWRSFRRR